MSGAVQVVNPMVLKKIKEKKMKKLIVLIAAMVLVAGYASAAEWSFYGSARIATFIDDVDGAPDTVFSEGLQGNSRFGFKSKVSDELSGAIEVGNSSSTWNTRIVWGEWNFGGGSFGVGQHYSPLNLFYSNQVYGGDQDMLNYGGVYSGRAPMLRLKFGSFAIAAVKPAAGNIDMPTIEASYSLKFDKANVQIAGAYDAGPDTGDASYVVAVGASLNLGPVSLGGDVYMGDNAEQLIWTTGAGEDNLGYLIVLGFKANDMVSFEAGYGNAEGDVAGATVDNYSYYAQAVITLAPGVYVIPEIGAVNSGNTDYYGAKWQINF
ncbi:MAG: porin [Proteobacteria bacterium]|nr:porin [Pseudomonadota bacterium]